MATADREAPIATCAHCGEPHITRFGTQACVGHRSEKRGGGPCTQPPVLGATVCGAHGGRAPQVKAAAARRRATAALEAEIAAAKRIGVELEERPLPEVALQLVRVWRGTELFLRERVRELDGLTRESKELEAALAVLGGGGKESKEIAQRAPAGIYGQTDPRNWKAERHVVYAMWEDASDRVMRYVKACREAGVEEARLALDQDRAREMADVISRTLRALLTIVVELAQAAGVAGFDQQVWAVWAEQVPVIVRREIEQVVGSDAV